MKSLKTFFLVIFLSLPALLTLHAQTPGFEWAVQAGGDSLIMGYSMVIDPSGNQIIVGHFKGTVDFNPDPGVEINITSNGLDDIFIQKLDVNGNLMWAAGMGDVDNDRARCVTTDASGNIYMTGYFVHSMDADPGPGIVLLTQTQPAAFVLKINPAGNLVWARQMGYPGDNGLAYGYVITLDNNQNVLTAGIFVGRIDFDPGSGTYNMASSGGSYDIFIQKLDNYGNFIWAEPIAGASAESITAITTDGSGNIYTTGHFLGITDFNPDRKLKYQLTPVGEYDIFYQKLNANGSFVWAKQVGSPGIEYSYALNYNASGFLYSTGQFYATTDFNPGPGTFNLTPVGQCDLFVLKLDLNGSFQWAQQIGGPSWDSGGDIESDIDGNIYMTGYFYATTDFNPDPANNYYMTANGNDDIFLYKANSNGNFLWAEHVGGTGWDYGLDLALDASGDIYTIGCFQGTADFNPDGDDTFEMTASGDYSMAVLKLNPSGGDYCPVPSGLAATNISPTAADLSWSEVTDVTGYYVRFREISTPDWTLIADPVAGKTMTINGLTEATNYESQVKTDCQSNYSYSGEFATSSPGCTDVYEPNESSASAAIIPVNTDIFALISTASDVDWFTFSTTVSAKNVQITLTNLPADYNVKLYKSNGALIGSSAKTGVADEMITYNTTKTGTYNIYVYGYAGAFDPGNCYTLRAGVSSTSFKLALAENFEAEEELSVYPNPSGSTFNFRLETTSKELVTIQLYDFSGRLVSQYNGLSPDNIITIGENLENGIYLAVVTQGALRKFVRIAKVN
jgi:hypothetical protein